MNVAHTNQVQKCKIHPANPNLLGTVSFDGSLRMWDIQKMTLVQHFEDKMAKGIDSIVQCLAFP